MPEQETDKPEQESFNLDTIKDLPALEEFDKYSSDEQQQIIEKFSNVKEQPVVESEKPDEDSKEEKTEEEPTEEKKEPEPEKEEEKKTDNQDLEKKHQTLEKSYKELQAEYTRTRQEIKALNEKMSSVSQPKADSSKVADEDEDLLKLANGDKNSEAFLKSLGKVIEKKALEIAEKRIAERLKPIEEQAVSRAADENLTSFNNQVTKFLESPLADMKESLNAIISEKFGSNEELLEAAKKDKNLFDGFHKELLSRHFEKAAELVQKSKSKAPDPKKRNEEIKKTGVTGKSTVSPTTQPDPSDLEHFKTLSSKEQEAYLRKQGLLKIS